ncbi:hypothetical protein [Streptomyces olivaceus]|uniref:hypothetical protein n=1 Tax=Streptomyces olivaceus TaxID=47716 RepID=UPI00362E8FD1
MPSGGNFDGCNCGPEAASCESPTQPVATVGLCLPDGTPIAVTVTRDCAGATITEGWIDVLTGAYTAGPPPDGAGPCSAGCVDTVCRTLCDDADGDGQADTTYSELWCVRANGTAELVLTYRDDPSQPYEPLAPVDCTYGCPEPETITLCDDTGAFLRRYTWLNGVATFEDFALDGQTPHLVTGDVGTCAAGGSASGCEASTTPAATLGLCLADGTPVAVLVTRDCEGTVTQDGWLNLTSGTYSAGPPPAGTTACGATRDVTTAGTFCDVDAAGDVVGLVLVEYTYGSDGTVESVRLVDAVTGETYTPQGEITTCPAGAGGQPQHDLVQLCDTATDGTVVPFVRDFARDENGAITGHSDYDVDGAPYTVTGTVGLCTAETECQSCQTFQLCDTFDDVAPAPILVGASQSGAQQGTTANGVGWAVDSGTLGTTSGGGANWWNIAQAPSPVAGPLPMTFDRPVSVTWSARVGIRSTSVGRIVMPEGTELVELAPTHVWDAATRTLTAGPGSTVAQTNGASTFTHPGPVTALSFATDGTTGIPLTQRAVGLFYVTPWPVEFLRTVCRDCTGTVASVSDTLLDGATEYTPAGTVGACRDQADPCSARNVLSACRWDDTDGDGLADTEYVELLAVDCDGLLTPAGAYTCDLSAEYTPVSPVPPPQEDLGAEPVVGVRARRVEIAPGETWDAAAFGTLRSVTATAHGGTGQVTTMDGTSTLFTSESVTWGVDKDIDARITGPLTIAAVDGTVTVAFTTGVDL